jgi:hypothetical protein
LKTLSKYLVLLAFCVTPAFAEDEAEYDIDDVTDEQYDAFISAVAANGCEMTEAEAEVILPAVGIDEETSGLIAMDLIEENHASLSDDEETFFLFIEECEPG